MIVCSNPQNNNAHFFPILAIASLVGAPRVLQALGKDKLYPYMEFFSKVKKFHFWKNYVFFFQNYKLKFFFHLKFLIIYLAKIIDFWTRFYIVVLGIAFFPAHLLSIFYLYCYIPFLFGLLFPCSTWNIFIFNFCSISVIFQFLFLFYRGHILNFLHFFFKIAKRIFLFF